eukprot:PRCOL_00002979-RA
MSLETAQLQAGASAAQPVAAAAEAVALAKRLSAAARHHATDLRAAPDAFVSGSGGAGCRRALAELDAALQELSLHAGGGGGGSGGEWLAYEVLTLCLRCGWAGAAGAAHAAQCIEGAALATGSWVSPRPADAHTRRLCLQAFRLHMLAAERMFEMATQGLRSRWTGVGISEAAVARNQQRLARESFEQRLASLGEWIASLRGAGEAAARTSGEGDIKACPAAWERAFSETPRRAGIIGALARRGRERVL